MEDREVTLEDVYELRTKWNTELGKLYNQLNAKVLRGSPDENCKSLDDLNPAKNAVSSAKESAQGKLDKGVPYPYKVDGKHTNDGNPTDVKTMAQAIATFTAAAQKCKPCVTKCKKYVKEVPEKDKTGFNFKDELLDPSFRVLSVSQQNFSVSVTGVDISFTGLFVKFAGLNWAECAAHTCDDTTHAAFEGVKGRTGALANALTSASDRIELTGDQTEAFDIYQAATEMETGASDSDAGQLIGN